MILYVFITVLGLFFISGIRAEEDLFQAILHANGKDGLAVGDGEGGIMFSGSSLRKRRKETLVEGDIVETPIVKATINEIPILYDANSAASSKWKNGFVPYVFASSGAKRKLKKAVEAAAADYKKNTCIRWKEMKTRKQAQAYGTYIEFYVGNGCFSWIGRQNGKQRISLGTGCNTKGIATHEMMHALGFWHEQSRRDRDKYIRIVWKNISPAFKGQFKKYNHGKATTHGEPYDEGSVMHYGSKAFSRNQKVTIESKRGRKIGQRKGLSKIDISQLKKHYNCPKTSTRRTTRRTSRRTSRRKSTSTPRRTSRSKSPSTSRRTSRIKSSSISRRTTRKKSQSKKRRTSQSQCKNKSQYCVTWAKEGHCKATGKFYAFMKRDCKQACRFCK